MSLSTILSILMRHCSLKTCSLLLILLAANFSQAATSVTRHGITWYFQNDYQTGTFANGDPWVKENTLGAGIIITNIDPYPEIAPRYKNGSMINVTPNQYATGYDESATYQASLNVVHDPANDFPLAVSANSSLISSIGMPIADDRPALLDASVLTVLPANVTPDPGDFRPPYAGTDKNLNWNTADIVWSRLPSLTPPFGNNVPSISSQENNTERVWLLHEHTSLGRAIHPARAMPEYGRDLSKALQSAMLRTLLNDPLEDKKTLVIQLIQIGIDIYGCVDNGMTYPANGGHNQGMKAPLLYAGWLLNDSNILWYGDKENFFHFQEDESTFYVSQTEVDMTHSSAWNPDERSGIGIPYETSDIGMPEWGIRHKSRPELDSANWAAIYRDVTGPATVGHALVMTLMGLEATWNWPPFFDYYKNRFYPASIAGRSEFIANMWDTYGENADTQAPSNPSNLSAKRVTTTSLSLAWSPSSDNLAVVGYYIYSNEDNRINAGNITLFEMSNLQPGTEYTFSVSAYDTVGNESEKASITVKTNLKWMEFSPDAEGYIDTGDWIGWLYVNNYPWMYSYSLNSWIYAKDHDSSGLGTWVYLRK